jgi:hypothetical protein
MKAIFRSRSSPSRSGRQWAIAAATALVLALPAMILPTPASAVDINGVAAVALHYARVYARLPGHHPGGHVAAKRDSDDDDDDGGNGRTTKSASSGSHNPSSRPAHDMHEAAQTGASSEAMVSLDRSLEGPESSHSR